jgi:hypothetical protein
MIPRGCSWTFPIAEQGAPYANICKGGLRSAEQVPARVAAQADPARALFAVGEMGLAGGSPSLTTNTMTNFHHLGLHITPIFAPPFRFLFDHSRAGTYNMDFPRNLRCICIFFVPLFIVFLSSHLCILRFRLLSLGRFANAACL